MGGLEKPATLILSKERTVTKSMNSNPWKKMNYQFFSWFEETIHEQP
jgi:hypothetical protein